MRAASVRAAAVVVIDALDNAMAESWVASFKAESVQHRIYPGIDVAETEALEWISFSNHDRLHESLGYLSPARFERGVRRELRRPFGPRRAVQPALAGSAGRPGNNQKP